MLLRGIRSRFDGMKEAESGSERVLWRRERQECVEDEELWRCVGVMDRFAFIE